MCRFPLTMFSSASPFGSLEPVAATPAPVPDGLVLLVEDEDSLADLLGHLLRRMQVKVVRAGDGATARQLFAENRDKITMAFVDCHLPDMEGAALCHELRAAAPRLPLLLTSGRDQRALQQAFSAGGPCQFLPKPYMPGDVISRVNALLGGSG